MTQPLKSCNRAAKVAWCPTDAAPSLLAMGTSAVAGAADAIVGGANAQPALDFTTFDPAKPAADMDVQASVRTSSRFCSLSWGNLGADAGCPYGVIAGGLQDGTVALWNPHAIVSSNGQDHGLISTIPVHQGSVNCLEFNPLKSSILASCGADSQVKIINIENHGKPEMFAPSAEPSKHAGSDVLCCAWNRKVQHILCSCSNAGSTIVWDLKMKKEVINFKDPSNRMRCSAVAWHPDVPTQLIVAYDDDRHPSMQMWDLRNCQYPFKESAGHTKGILGVEWCASDPNLVLSCGKDNKIHCWCLANGSLESFSEISSQQGNYEARWAPKRPGILASSSMAGVVNVFSMQTQQNPEVKYCPKWYSKSGGVSFGFGAKMMAFGTKTPAPAEGQPAPAPSSWCHSLVVPGEPELVPAADMFERWIADRRLRDFCTEKTQQCGGSADHDGLMWDLMGSKFEGEEGRQRLPALLGFNADEIANEAEGFLGKKPGSTLMAQPEDAPAQGPGANAPPAPPVVQEALDPFQAEDFFNDLAQNQEQKKLEEEAAELKRRQMEEMGKSAEMNGRPRSGSNDWSDGPDALIKKSLMIGNLPAAVECCFKSGRMAEGLLLASGGGIALWTRARDEYLRLQGDPFLTAVGNIMTNDFDKLVASSNLTNWKETLAICATYSGDQYQGLCLQLAERLEKEKFDIRSAVICYICAGDFSKTVSIWSNTHVASQGSKNLALQDLVEKMAVFQEATKFNQPDALYNAKLTQYAEILANSGRLTAAMRYLCLLRDDSSSAMLRERIYNSSPMQMNQLFGRPPAFPFEPMDVRVTHTPMPHQAPAQPQAGSNPYSRAAPAAPSAPSAPAMPRANMGGMPAPAMPSAPGPRPGYGAAPNMPSAPSAPMNPSQPPAPNMNMPPRPNMGAPGPAPSACGGYGGMPPQAHHQQPQHQQPQYQQQQPQAPYQPTAPTAGPGVLPPGGYGGMSPAGAPAMGGPPRPSTAPMASAMPVVDNMPVSWPVPNKTQQQGSTTNSVAAANKAVQELSAGGGARGEPMAPQDLAQVKNTMGMLLESQTDPRKRDDIAKRLEDLYSKLESGAIKSTPSQKLMQLVKAVEAQDLAAASRCQQELCSMDWEQNKFWLMGLKRLMTR
eukprot:TRINITY_DN26327_c0_g5_i1.p1 TRINITY_DN26327_c0_g5~~TRINITY_DN26327_c0_g5_i1.p1  ORF type:complete len:1130 (-),score=215.34 TRINITY_DN26327_c0_g5_i1:160-3549(-)